MQLIKLIEGQRKLVLLYFRLSSGPHDWVGDCYESIKFEFNKIIIYW